MSHMRETTIHKPLKLWKALTMPTIKVSDVFYWSMKAALAVCVVASISLVSYKFAFSTQSRWLGNAGGGGGGGGGGVVDVGGPAGYGSQRTNISHILFGIGGSTKTWHKRRRYCEQWWKPDVMRGFVWLDKRPPADVPWPDRSPPYRVSEETSRFKYTSWYGSRSAIRIARIVKESFKLGESNVRWFVMGDDDTVFFTDNLVSVLAKYDHNQMYYIGGNSESVEQDYVHSYNMAYGGGGFAISYPLAAVLVGVLDDCINRYSSFYGSDQKIQACMDEIGVPVTKELGFHQLDIRGDPYGLLAAHPVAPLVSLHHLDYVRPLFPSMNRTESLEALVQAYAADPGRTLQHSFCYDVKNNMSVYVAWGYTIQLYEGMVTAKVLETPLQTFRTWQGSKKPFTFNTRPFDPNPCKRPEVYFLDRVEKPETRRTLTAYKRMGGGHWKDCLRDGHLAARVVEFFNVSAPELEPEFWLQAPRRQCCEIVDDGKREEGVVDVRIRGCGFGETVTPL